MADTEMEQETRQMVHYYVSRLQGLSSDAFRSHKQADDLLCEFLWEAGYEAVMDAYKSARSHSGFSY